MLEAKMEAPTANHPTFLPARKYQCGPDAGGTLEFPAEEFFLAVTCKDYNRFRLAFSSPP